MDSLIVHDCTPPIGQGRFLALQSSLPEWPTSDEYRAALPALARLAPSEHIDVTDKDVAATAHAISIVNSERARAMLAQCRTAISVGLTRQFTTPTSVIATNEDGTRGAILYRRTPMPELIDDDDPRTQGIVQQLSGVNAI